MTNNIKPEPNLKDSPLRIVDPAKTVRMPKGTEPAERGEVRSPKNPPNLNNEQEKKLDTADNGPSNSTSPGDAKVPFWKGRGGRWGAGVAAVLMVAQIPVPITVGWPFGSKAVFATLPRQTKLIDMPGNGVIAEVHVDAGDTVEVGDVLFTVESEELKDKLADAKIARNSLQSNLQQQEKELQIAQGAVLEAQQLLDQGERRLADLEADLRGRDRHPDLRVQESDIGRLKAQLPAIRRQQSRVKAQIEALEQEIADIQPLVDEGALPQKHLRQSQQSLLSLQERLDALEQEEINTREQAGVGGTRVDQAQYELTEQRQKLRDDRDRSAFGLLGAKRRVREQEKVVRQLQAELAAAGQKVSDLESRLTKSTTIRATSSGRVLSTDAQLSDLQERGMQQGDLLIKVGNVDRLVAKIEINAADAKLVKPGNVVWIDPRNTEVERFQAKLSKVDPGDSMDATEQRSVLFVYAEFENPDGALNPDGVAQVAIETDEVWPLWRAVGNELDKNIFSHVPAFWL